MEPQPSEPYSVGPYQENHPRLTRHIPIRFDSETLEAAKEIAEADGVTVSSWIRILVRKEIKKRTGVIIDPIR
jgi:hypothetical protein